MKKKKGHLYDQPLFCPAVSGFQAPYKHQNQYISEKSQQCYPARCMMMIVYHACAAMRPAMSDPTACMLLICLICQLVTIRSDPQ